MSLKMPIGGLMGICSRGRSWGECLMLHLMWFEDRDVGVAVVVVVVEVVEMEVEEMGGRKMDE